MNLRLNEADTFKLVSAFYLDRLQIGTTPPSLRPTQSRQTLRSLFPAHFHFYPDFLLENRPIHGKMLKTHISDNFSWY